jgi:isohexenylglutaconyl-CoA hydratase
LLASVERCAPGANAEAKRLFRTCRTQTSGAYIETAAKSFAEALRGSEGREGMSAFMEKRPPSWTRGA